MTRREPFIVEEPTASPDVHALSVSGGELHDQDGRDASIVE